MPPVEKKGTRIAAGGERWKDGGSSVGGKRRASAMSMSYSGGSGYGPPNPMPIHSLPPNTSQATTSIADFLYDMRVVKSEAEGRGGDGRDRKKHGGGGGGGADPVSSRALPHTTAETLTPLIHAWCTFPGGGGSGGGGGREGERGGIGGGRATPTSPVVPVLDQQLLGEAFHAA